MERTVLSQNMRKARDNKGWSQDGAAAAIRDAGAPDFTRSRLGSIEEGRVQTVKYHVQKAIEKAYSIQNFERFMNDPNYYESEITGYELEKRYRSLPPESKKVVDMLLGLA